MNPDGAALLLDPGAPLHTLAARTDLPHALSHVLALPKADTGAPLAGALARGCAPLLAALLALDAHLQTDHARLPIDERLTTDGRLLPHPGESLRMLELPPPHGPSTARARRDLGLGVAAVLTTGDGGRVARARLVWWGVAPAPLVAHQLAAVLQGRTITPALIDLAAQTARGEVQPAGAGAELEDARLAAVATLCRQTITALRHAAAGPTCEP